MSGHEAPALLLALMVGAWLKPGPSAATPARLVEEQRSGPRPPRSRARSAAARPAQIALPLVQAPQAVSATQLRSGSSGLSSHAARHMIW